ncbi:LamB/YcsF family protein [Psychroflexus sp. ALD_RP9]|uniref:LamB/YcsF family protein n=1 Tax=Psychroflexus sp. ALD_RP9 TaxID=2777186 RepID=UPI001A8FBE45|nr:LamB/YcsF family protein [Psychroflexus sp. ALD_RP9]QSS97277.1 LamB/YcsF family protein [Psychroflexus sp. ALD_RP9]
MKHININCDLAEGYKYDSQIMPLISSCNIACGGHYGNDISIQNAIQQAQQHQVKIGAHPSFPDKENFGRKFMNLKPKELTHSLNLQLKNFKRICQNENADWHHIKFHGALYNQLAKDKHLAELCFEVIEDLNREVVVFTLPESELLNFKSDKVKYWIEGFADRTYTDDFSLTPRKFSNAMLHTSKEILHQTLSLAEAKIISTSGKIKQQTINTICLHSDSKLTLNHLEYLHEQLPKFDYEIER